MEASETTLYERVDTLIRSYKGSGAQPLLATTDMHAAIHELIARSEGLEEAVREIALEVERLEAVPEHRVAAVN